MSVNIKAPTLKVASNVTVTVPTRRLSARQINTLATAIRTGFVHGGGVVSDIASAVRRSYDASLVESNNCGFLGWERLETHEKKGVIALLTTARLLSSDSQHIQKLIAHCPETGSFHADSNTTEAIKTIELDVHPELSKYSASLLRGEVNEITYSVFKNKC